MASVLYDLVTDFGRRAARVTHVQDLAQRPGVTAPWPTWVDPAVVKALQGIGIEQPWRHQVQAAESVHAGRDTIMSTGTASGKSLGFLLPILDVVHRTRNDPPLQAATALYVSPTKALGHDQLAKVSGIPLQGLRPGSYDGDTSQANRDWARSHANLIFTNPDMLHQSILPQHTRFRRWLRTLRYIVIDEAHRYRGVFGSHVALVIRRLVRIAQHYGAEPVIVAASATMAEPARAFERFTGRPAVAIQEDFSPRSAGQFLLWEPPLLAGWDPSLWDPNAGAVIEDQDAGRRSTLSEAADLLADTTAAGYRSIAFIGSRRGTEFLADSVRSKVAEVAPELVGQIAAYRGGYLPEERRLLETGLRSGALRTVASTNALELGIDISGLDIVIMVGWPGTLASLWQQAGRAGRSGREWIAVLIARSDPLDTYVVHHPEAIFDRPVDAGVIDPGNPYVLGGHLAAAASELPLTKDDLVRFGPHAREVVDQLVAEKLLRSRPAGWYWTKAESAAALINIRGGSGGQVRIVEAASGQMLGTVDQASAFQQCHPGAVYLHQGRQFLVAELDLAELVALVEPAEVNYTTQAKSTTDIRVVSTDDSHALSNGITVHHGMVDVTDQVIGYSMRDRKSGALLGTEELDLPERTLNTHAVWWTIPETVLEAVSVSPDELPGAVHAAEHAAIGLLPLFAGCDRWDIGGVSTAAHPDTGKATIFVYDGQPGGAGFAERAYEIFHDWSAATRETIESCECAGGCPSCVQSPKCGNGNEPLDKDAAARLLAAAVGL